MCPAVCVGSLVADRPLQGALHVGELITFHPPNVYSETYTHQVSKIFANGMIQTRGIGNPTHDPWLITRSEIVGVGVFSVWGIGWIFKALPMLAVGVLLWVLARPLLAQKTRRAWDRGWMTVLAVVPLWMLHPLMLAVVKSSAPDRSHPNWQRDTVVNTGILPISVRAPGGQVADHLSTTGVAHVAGPTNSSGYLVLHETVSLYWWGWTLLALVVAAPLAGYLWHIWRGNEAVDLSGKAELGAALVPI